MPTSSNLTLRVSLLATTYDNHVLMVRDESTDDDAWTLPGGTVPAGECPVRTAQRFAVEQTGYFQPFDYALSVSLETDTDGELTGVEYLLDGGQTGTVPTEADALHVSARWQPMSELLESRPAVQHALLALARGERVPVLVNGEQPNAD
ncbi:NUDIX domain-containing protein [Streptomyces profundus]|uniref:NUDIX domain-containing protein n=1 Tax=Streptomyces profundus TaxID=2867410 RepID=UPI001D168F59|nr:NUDIX hydrolase [Streptomyces sp. MA3_2.13]UED85700.1 NUDIX hydrolase [Streptomyces sp. MA3_2.13]